MARTADGTTIEIVDFETNFQEVIRDLDLDLSSKTPVGDRLRTVQTTFQMDDTDDSIESAASQYTGRAHTYYSHLLGRMVFIRSNGPF